LKGRARRAQEGTRIALEKAKLSSQEIVPLVYRRICNVDKNFNV